MLGCVSRVNATDLAISLPNNLTGFVPLTSISKALTKRIESLVEDSDEEGSDGEKNGETKDEHSFDLTAMFHVGQYLRACVIHSVEDVSMRKGASGQQNKTKRHIVLSLEPSMTNVGLSPNELVVGTTIQASVSSVEDHGLIMELDINGDVKGFLAKKELGHCFSMTKMIEGQVILCTVTGLSSNGKIVKLSADLEQKPSKKGKFAGGRSAWWVSQAPTIDTFLPGTGVEVLLTEVGNHNGLVGKIMGMLDATIDFFHVAGWSPRPLEERFKAGDKVRHVSRVQILSLTKCTDQGANNNHIS